MAVKVLPDVFASRPDRLARFEREARAAGALTHPNILSVHDVGRHEGRPYVVFELLDGTTLRARLQEEDRLPLRKCLEIAVQIAHGLDAAHGKGIVHQHSRPAGRMGWEAAVDLLAGSRAAEVAVGFYGGEPLLEEDLLRRGVERAQRVLPSSRRRVRLHLTTNGTLLDPGLAAFHAAHGVDVQLSFDGVRAA